MESTQTRRFWFLPKRYRTMSAEELERECELFEAGFIDGLLRYMPWVPLLGISFFFAVRSRGYSVLPKPEWRAAFCTYQAICIGGLTLKILHNLP